MNKEQYITISLPINGVPCTSHFDSDIDCNWIIYRLEKDRLHSYKFITKEDAEKSSLWIPQEQTKLSLFYKLINYLRDQKID